MKPYDVQEVELAVAAPLAFAYIADPRRLPEWTHAFVSADDTSATMRTPAGESRVGMAVDARSETGTVDWTITFPDGNVGRAHSRIVPLGADRCAYTFVLHAPPVPLERLEGSLAAQRETLADELRRLKRALERA